MYLHLLYFNDPHNLPPIEYQHLPNGPFVITHKFNAGIPCPEHIVFTTAYQNYAVEGFELNSVDYLLKPITYERFYQAIQKVRDRLTIQPAQQTAPVVDYIFIKQDSRLVRIHFDQIRYVEAEKDFSTVFTTDKKLLAGMHLKMFESMLPPDRFFRVHRSFVVNLSKISSINGNMVEIGQTEIPIGANFKNELMKKLGIAG